ncbi:type II toxin-antitoxin system Phd/YefM family antitoxin [Oceanispirochaeta sp.]|jgi:antitoxin (DNA-binding transcriptional repressor) of toxin-antitoxin stability system|uniref:type II toxin-antitoxin system Phd/YefM family antitoxin n=1 Tax=Oceanispirochaeta sp. TaxID=2035350 RepID=UPI00261BC66C|nr:type II toxin-antitoxin system Phd/YefM family antitoxin [Oceanispirochaeta sp.]MDA3955251.1 type II toxin-antitoxin system Phd/YefM family antitoxin [Oceanispirochaeta sp.]
MKFVTVRDIRTTPAKIWKSLPEEQELILTNNGKPIALITPLGENDLEQTLTAVRTARAQSAIQQMQLSSIRNNLSQLSIEEIEAEISNTRKSR